MQTRACVIVFVCLSVACKRAASEGPESVSDQSEIPVHDEGEAPRSAQTCYVGVAFHGTSEADLAAAPHCEPAAEGCMDPQPVAVRRSATPSESTIVEEWVAGPTESTLPTATTLTMTITGAQFALTVTEEVNPRGAGSERAQLSWTGSGELSGEPWAWTSWTSKQERRPPIVDVVTTELEGESLRRLTEFTMQSGSVALRRRDELQEFPCAEWDARATATLDAPTPR